MPGESSASTQLASGSEVSVSIWDIPFDNRTPVSGRYGEVGPQIGEVPALFLDD